MEKICVVEDSALREHPDIRDRSLFMGEVGREKMGGKGHFRV